MPPGRRREIVEERRASTPIGGASPLVQPARPEAVWTTGGSAAFGEPGRAPSLLIGRVVLSRLVRLLLLALVAPLLTLVGGGAPAVAQSPVLAAAVPPGGAAITGQVFGPGGRPVDGVLVEALRAEDGDVLGATPVATALTYEADGLAHGGYRLEVEPGEYVVRFSSLPDADRIWAPTTYRRGATVTVAEGADTDLDDVVLSPAAPGTVTGSVVDEQGDPWPRISVGVFRVTSGGSTMVGRAVTDRDGRYMMRGLVAGGRYTVGADGAGSADGQLIGRPAVYLGAAPTPALAETVGLAPGASSVDVGALELAPGVVLSGRVAHADGTVPPRADVRAVLVDRPGGPLTGLGTTTEVEADGSWSVRVLPGYDLSVQVYVAGPSGSRGGDVLYYLGDTMDPDRARVLPVGPDGADAGTIIVGGEEQTRLRLRVVDSHGVPFGGDEISVEVLLRSADGVVHQAARAGQVGSGAHVARVGSGGTYTVVVLDQFGGQTYLGGGRTRDGATWVATEPGQETADLGTMVLPVPSSFTGSVLIGGQAPTIPARVDLVWFGPDDDQPYRVDSTWTRADGDYTLRVPRQGQSDDWRLSVRASLPGGEPGWLGGDEATAERLEAPRGNRALDPIDLPADAAMVGGTVVDATGESFDGSMTVRLHRRDGFRWTQVGEVELRGSRWGFAGVVPGVYAVTVEAQGEDRVLLGGLGAVHPALLARTPQDAPLVQVTADDVTVEADPITVRPSATLSGVLRRADGTPAADHPVDVTLRPGPNTDDFASSPVDGRGRYTLTGLPPGRYDLQVREIQGPDPQFGAGVSGIDLGWGDDVTVDPQLMTGRTFQGVVRDEHGDPVAGADVHLYFHSCTDSSCSPLASTRTDAQGRYSYVEGRGTAGSWVRVAAEWPAGGYDLEVSDEVVRQGTGVVVTTDFDLAPAERVLRAVVRGADDGVLDGRILVELLRGSQVLAQRGAAADAPVVRVAFRDVDPGDYRLRATPQDGAETRYLPATTDVTVAGTGIEVAPDLVLIPTAGLAGTVTVGTGAVPVDGATVHFAYAGADGPASASTRTQADGGYELRTPAGATGTLTVSTAGGMLRTVVLDDVAAGTAPGQTARQDVAMPTDWDGRPGDQLDHCLTRRYDDGVIRFDGLELALVNGYLAPAGWDPYASDADLQGTVPYLAPLPGDSGGVRWGVSPDGRQLCLQVNAVPGLRSDYQVLLTSRDDGGHDVAYTYGSIASYDDSRPAGHHDGFGAFATTTEFSGWQDGGYYGGEESDLVARTDLPGSTGPGRASFVFHGFDPGAAPVSVGRGASVDGVRRVGRTLTVMPGAWSVEGMPAPVVRTSVRWLRDDQVVGTGPTYRLTQDDAWSDLRVEVEAFVEGHEPGRAVVRVRDVGPGAVASWVRRPSLTGTPVVGQPVPVDLGEWRPRRGLSESDLEVMTRWELEDGTTTRRATFVPGPEQAGLRVRLLVGVFGPGESAIARTAWVPIVAGAPLTVVDAPVVTGEPTVGSLLTVTDDAEWDAADVTVTYEWFSGWRARAAVDGSDGRSYRVTAADLDQPLTLVATASAPGRASTSERVALGTVLAAGTRLAPVVVWATDALSGLPVAGAEVRVCVVGSIACTQSAPATADGHASVQVPVDRELRLVVRRDGYRAATAALTVDPGQLDATVRLALTPRSAPPSNVALPTASGTRDGSPVLALGRAHELEVTGCANPDASYTITLADGREVSGVLVPDDAGASTTFRAATPELDAEGWARVTTNVAADCSDPGRVTELDVYIDPSGVVTDQYGTPIAGATVVLQRADSAAGPFARVPDGSSVMSPDNRQNPDTTDAFGGFRWDVTPGWYRVRATAPGCASALTEAMQVPPERIDLLVALECAGAAAPTPRDVPSIAGTPQVGRMLTAVAAGWRDGLEVSRVWLRDGRAIPGARGATYVVTAADADHELSVRETGRRPAYVQEAGRGAPVVFAGGSVTSAPVPVTTPPSGGGDGDLPSLSAPRPVLVGPGEVGTTLSAPDPVWSASGVTTTREWLVDGDVVDHDGATYELTPAELGTEVTVRYTGRRSGYADGTVTTAPVLVVAGAAPTAEAPRLRGPARVGSTLSVDEAAWSADGVVTSRQWRVDGRPVPGATGPTFALHRSHLGREISVVLTGTREGYADGEVVSATRLVRPGARPVALRRPFVVGQRVLGRVLEVRPGRWDASGLRFSYQWLRDGEVVRGATGQRLRVRPAHVGHRLRVVVTASRPGHLDGRAVTKVVRVRR